MTGQGKPGSGEKGGGPLRTAALCTHCGYCLPQCPTYRAVNNELFSPRGRVSLILAMQHGELSPAEVTAALESCLGCRACHPACPAGVKPGKLVVVARGRAPRPAPWSVALLHRITGSHRTTALVSRLLGFYHWSGLQALVRWSRVLGLIPPLARWEGLMPARRRPPRPRPGNGERGAVGLLAGCIGRLLMPAVAPSSANLLEQLGFRVVIPGGFGCCGAPHREAGEREAFLARARATLAAFEPHLEELAAVVCDSGVCAAAARNYGKALGNDPRWGALAHRFAAKVVPLSQFLADQGAVTALPWRDPGLGTLAVHDHCQLRNGLGTMEAPRQLLGAWGELPLEPADPGQCCGAGGDFQLRQPDLSTRVREARLAALAECRADTVVGENPGCLLNLEAGWREPPGAGKTRRPLRMRHLAEVLWRACRDTR